MTSSFKSHKINMRPKFENVDLFWGKMDIDILKLIYTYQMDSHRQTDLDIDLF